MSSNPVYSLDLNGGLTYYCHHPQCTEWNQDGQRSFWRRNDMPENLVPVGWKVTGALFYKCPICYQQDLQLGEEEQPEYIEIHHPNQVESDFAEGGIPNITQGMGNMTMDGGRRKRTRKRRRKRRRKKRTRKRRKRKR